MYLKSLELIQFRNYQEQQVEFLAPKTILVGDNAQGKTNLIEAVGLLSTLKSHRVRRDRNLIQDGKNAGRITGYLERNGTGVELAISLRSNGRRTCKVNGDTCRKQIDFLGTLNAVQFSSLDLELVRAGPEKRRSWLDSLLVQLEPVYAHILQQYNKVMRQRNALLKELRKESSEGVVSSSANSYQARDSKISELALWDAQLAAVGAKVTVRRSRALELLTPIAVAWHSAISGETEVLEIKYLPNVEAMQDLAIQNDPERRTKAFLEKIQEKAIAEKYQGTSLVGPHRDEIAFFLNQQPVREYGSHGQQRTLVLALKLAELKLIEEVVGEPPILLLDDVLAELDPNRQKQLLDAIQDRFQTLITTTHIDSFAREWIDSSQILSVKAGRVFREF